MTIIYMVAAIIGAIITASLLGQHSLIWGALAAPFGGTFVAGATAVLVHAMRGLSSSEPEIIPPGVIWC
jgi:branched-subunit amino acid transport protein